MSRTLNKTMLIGRVGNEPEIRTVASGKKVAKLTLATDSGTKEKPRTQWHRLTAWDRTAEIIESYVHKGDRLYVEGSIEYSQTEDDNGKPRYWTDIVIRELVMLSGNQEPKTAQPSASPFESDDDDLGW